MAAQPLRGEIWLANLDPTLSHEQAGNRPVLIISTNQFNRGPAGLIMVLPVTRTDRGIPAHVVVNPPEGGLSARSFILCDGIRSISKRRLGPQAWGSISPQTMTRVEEYLRLLLEL
ncbi:MAG: type II toxin-antitoxin system PemK/MazF family toxin [Caldilinea sp. CFX5]|nr:type II toxin-antitoxin system PemK/MazF family toxin [Caldilinea sp. CFX5]